MALFVGFMVQLEEKGLAIAAFGQPIAPGLTPEKLFLNRKVFFAVLPILFALILTIAIPIRISLAARQRAYNRMLSETPTNDGLRPIQPMTADEAFILSDIVGFHPAQPVDSKTFGKPFGMYHELSYRPTQNDPPTNLEVVSVEVWQYPNAQWALYLAEYPANFVHSFDNPKHHAVTTKFQNKVRTNLLERLPGFEHFPGGGGWALYYMWPSGSNVLTITYHTKNEHEEFLRLYLEKYPSAMK